MPQDAPGPAATDTQPVTPPSVRIRDSAVATLKGILFALCGWPRGHWPIPTVTSLLILAVLLVVTVELLPKRLSDVTLTVRSRTEVLELELQPERTYVWWLPPGSYSLLTAQTAGACEQRKALDVVCAYAEPTAVTIRHGGTVRFEVLPSDSPQPRFGVALTPRADATAPSSFEIRRGDGTPVQTTDLLTFESQPVEHWRIPLIARRVQIGEFLSESVGVGDGLGGLPHEPIMTEGDVRMFARSFGSLERYQVKEERFDPADVVQIPAEPGRDGLLLGLLSLDGDSQNAFALTLHTDLAEVFVRRLGAAHKIGVSMWSILSQLPIWLALWVILVSLIVVANYHAARLSGLQKAPS
ncbi:MAG TPA: hypothetical protein VHH11_10195 [Gammaproteobacteria bacterium]|jgi:hypothetical protein|nr:hypothetical protein [Gammaproteobacteria bacterium]